MITLFIALWMLWAPLNGEEPSAPLPPRHLRGKTLKTEFLTQIEYAHKITWNPSDDPTVVGYKLRRNGLLIATLLATDPAEYIDHQRPKKGVDVYALTAVNIEGVESEPVIRKVK